MRHGTLLRAAGVAAALLPLIAFGGGGNPSLPAPAAQPPPEPAIARLLATCVQCHEDIVEEWKTTRHAVSWTNAEFQAALKDRPDGGDSCAKCHAPASILETGVGNLPKARQKDRQLGVNCLTCHVLKGRYHGPHASTGHGGITADPAFLQPGICLSCHGQPETRKEHDQGTSFLAAHADGGGPSCQACHMPAVERKMVSSEDIRPEFLRGVVPCRTHVFRGVKNRAALENTVRLVARFDGDRILVDLLPVTGHSIPASTGRELRLSVVCRNGGGAETGRTARVFDFAKNDVLLPARTTTVEFPAPAGTRSVEVSLDHVLTVVPGREKEEAHRIAAISVERS